MTPRARLPLPNPPQHRERRLRPMLALQLLRTSRARARGMPPAATVSDCCDERETTCGADFFHVPLEPGASAMIVSPASFEKNIGAELVRPANGSRQRFLTVLSYVPCQRRSGCRKTSERAPRHPTTGVLMMLIARLYFTSVSPRLNIYSYNPRQHQPAPGIERK